MHDRSSYVPGAYGDGYGDRQAVAAAQLAAEAPPVGAVGAAVGEMLSSSVLADEIGEKVGELLRSRGAEGTEGRKSQAMAVLDQLNDLQGGQSRDRARGSPEEELDSDSQARAGNFYICCFYYICSRYTCHLLGEGVRF